MSKPGLLKILFCVRVFFGLCNAIISNEDILKSTNLEERKSIFRTEDGSIPECEVVELSRPSRSKRSGQNIIRIKMNTYDWLNATLYPVADDDLISRSRTGVWTARFSPTAFQNVTYEPQPQMFDSIGGFEFFQNVEEFSAITRFQDSNGNENLVGFIRVDFSLRTIPKNFEYIFVNISQNHSHNKRSVNSMNDPDEKLLFLTICKDPEARQEYFRRYTYGSDVRSDPNLHRSRRQNIEASEYPNRVYPKLLIIPEFGIVKRYAHVRDFMMQLFAQLNSLDMMFRQLSEPEVHLTIAAIIIPSDNASTPYLSKNMDAHDRIIGDVALYDTQKNFRNEIRRFPHSEWESILILTNDPITGFVRDPQTPVQLNGATSIADSCKRATIVRFTESLMTIFTLAHEFGHRFGARHDSNEEQCKDDPNNIMGVLTRSTELEWSICSRAALRSYFRSTRTECGYDRRWSIPNAVKNMPAAWLTTDRQCDNLYKNSTSSCIRRNSSPGCFIQGCVINRTCIWMPWPPLQGSLISTGDGLEACINGTMVSV